MDDATGAEQGSDRGPELAEGFVHVQRPPRQRSSGRPSRPTGMAATSASRAFWFIPCVIGVSIMPGATAPTRTPNAANSRDQVTVFAASADFAAV